MASLTFSGYGDSLVGRTVSNRVLRWSTENGSTIADQQLTDFTGPVAIARDADFVVGERGADGLVIWDLAANSLRHRLEAGEGGVSALAISPAGRFIAGAPTDTPEQVNIWDATSGQLLVVLEVPGDAKCELHFAEDEHSLTVVDTSGKLSVWEIPFKLPLGTFQLPGGIAAPYAVNPDGSRVATVADTTITIARIPSDYARPEPIEASLRMYTVSSPMELVLEHTMETYSAETGSAGDEPAMPADDPSGEPTPEPPPEASSEATAEAPSRGETAAPTLDSEAAEELETTTGDDSEQGIAKVPVLFGTNRASAAGAQWREYFAGFFFTWLSCLLYLLLVVAMIFAGMMFDRRAVRRTAAGFLVLLIILAQFTLSSNRATDFKCSAMNFKGALTTSEFNMAVAS